MKLCSTPIKFAIPKRAIVDTPGHSQADYITIVRHAPKWKLMNEERNGKKDCVVEHRKASRGCKRCSTTPKTIIWAALYENAVKNTADQAQCWALDCSQYAESFAWLPVCSSRCCTHGMNLTVGKQKIRQKPRWQSGTRQEGAKGSGSPPWALWLESRHSLRRWPPRCRHSRLLAKGSCAMAVGPLAGGKRQRSQRGARAGCCCQTPPDNCLYNWAVSDLRCIFPRSGAGLRTPWGASDKGKNFDVQAPPARASVVPPRPSQNSQQSNTLINFADKPESILALAPLSPRGPGSLVGQSSKGREAVLLHCGSGRSAQIFRHQ